jgi:hypothetical protein
MTVDYEAFILFFLRFFFLLLFLKEKVRVEIGMNVKRDLIVALQAHNTGTITPHMRVDPTHWDTPSCDGLLCPCCGLVVQVTFSMFKIYDKVGNHNGDLFILN